MRRYAIGLGSNLGDRLQHLTAAAISLEDILTDTAISSVYETAPVGGPEQGPYLNAVMVGISDLDEHAMLDCLHQIEQAHSRERDVRWGPRTLDLDIITTDGPTIETNRLVVPHPRANDREFVLRPLAEIWPEAPLGDITASGALDAIAPQGVERLGRVWVPAPSPAPATWLLVGQIVLMLAVVLAVASDGAVPGGSISPLVVLGILIGVAGVVLALWASRSLGSALTASPMPREGAPLVTTGPYRLARHPIYGGLVLLSLGGSLIFASRLGVAATVVLAAFFLIKARYEEHLLRMRHEGYYGYRKVVRRWLIPFVV